MPAALDDDLPEQRVLEMSVLLPPQGAVTGWGALRLHGANFHDGLAADGRTRLPVDLVVGPHRHRRPCPGVRWLQDRLDEDEVVVRQSIRVAQADRACFDAVRRAHDLGEAVLALEMAMAADLTSLRRMTAYADSHARWPGVPLVRSALGLASEDCRSPGEGRMLLTWQLDAGLPRPLVNREVFTLHGKLLGVADLLDVQAGVVGEYDGDDHSGARRRSSDARREGGLRDHGLEVFRVTGFDMRDPASVARRMHATRGRALAHPRQRLWTIEPPDGWETGLSLDERLDYRDFLRACRETWGDEASG